MNIYDVSKRAGVSIATVSRVINGNTNVSDKTKERVLDVMKELGYTPNVFARGLGLNTMHTIGIMCSDSSDLFLAEAVYYIEQTLRKNGYDAFLCCTGHELNNKKSDMALLLSKRVDAIVMVGSQYVEANRSDNDYIIEASQKVPVLMINGELSSPNIYCTLCDDYRAVRDTVLRLFANGRRRFLFLYRSDSLSSKTKRNGFLDGLAEVGLDASSDRLLLCSNDIGVCAQHFADLYPNGFCYDAVIAAEDSLAVGALKYAVGAGISVPKELEIVGYNNSILCNCTTPELTSLDNHVETLSVTAVNHLLMVLSGTDVPNKTTVSTDYVVRGTAR